MSIRVYRSLQALILAGLGLGLLVKVLDGHILLYIHQRFVVLVIMAALAMIALAQFIFREKAVEEAVSGMRQQVEQSTAWGLWLTALPLLVGLLVPEQPLGTSALQSRGIFTSAGQRISGQAAEASALPSTQRTILEWVRIYGASEDGEVPASAVLGQEADISGFVAHDPRLAAGQFLVGRFTITCCVADASALGMIVDWQDAANLPANRWVRVRGPVRPVWLDGRIVPAVEARTIELIPEPPQPYLFP